MKNARTVERAAIAFVLLLVLSAGLAGALDDPPPAAAELIERAIATHGGRTALEAFASMEKTGTYESFGRRAGRRTDIVHRERADGAFRTEIEFEFRGRKMTPVEFYDGVVHKRRFSTSWDDLPLVEVEEERDHRLPFLLALDPDVAEVTDGGTKVDVAVWKLSYPDAEERTQLYLAKDDARLVALDYPGTSADGMGNKEAVRREVIYRDFRPVGDLRIPFDVETHEDGSPQNRIRFDTIEILDAFDPAWLRVPDPTRSFIPSEEQAF